MSEPSGKLNLDEAMGRKPGNVEEIKPTLRIRRSDLKVLRRKPEPKKRTMAFGLGALAVAVILGAVLWFSRGAWLPFWQSVVPSQETGDVAEAAGQEGEADEIPGEAGGDGGVADAAGPEALPFEGGSLPPPETLAYFSAAGWDNESFKQAVRHFNAGFDAYKAFLADDTSSRPLAVAETEAIETLKLLKEAAGDVPAGMRNEVAYDILEARSLLAEVRRLARDPSAKTAEAAARKPAPPASSGDISSQPKVWKNPDYLEAARTFNRAVAKYKEFLADKAGKQALLKEIEDDAFSAAKKFESLKGYAPAGIPLQDHITQCYKLISDCRRQQLGSPAPQAATGRAHPARRPAP
jgi:hypothetical protein